jgi:hypothetical protein
MDWIVKIAERRQGGRVKLNGLLQELVEVLPVFSVKSGHTIVICVDPRIVQ